MEYVYRYTDIESGIVKYIGRTTSLKLRIGQHQLEDDFRNGNWEIHYVECQSRSQSEALESHFISVYQTDQWLNKAKREWGIIPEFCHINYEWKLFKIKAKKQTIPKHKSFFEVNKIYDFLEQVRTMIIDCIANSDKEYIVNIYKGEYELDTYLEFIGLYISNDRNNAYLIPNGYTLNIGECYSDGNGVYRVFKYPTNSKIQFMMTGNRCYDNSIDESLQRNYQRYNGKRFKNNHIDSVLYAHSLELEWQNDLVIMQGVPIYAKPFSNYIKSKLCVGEIRLDKYGTKCFWRWNGSGGITDIDGGITYIIPYGTSMNDYLAG